MFIFLIFRHLWLETRNWCGVLTQAAGRLYRTRRETGLSLLVLLHLHTPEASSTSRSLLTVATAMLSVGCVRWNLMIRHLVRTTRTG